MRISDWSSDVCSSDLDTLRLHRTHNSQPTNTGGDKAGPFQGGSMNTTLTASPPELREALYSLSMAKDVPDAALLDDFVRRFPQFGGELTNFAIAIAIDALHGDAVVEAAEAALDPNVLSPAVSRAMSRFQNRLHEVSEPTRLPAATARSVSADAINPFASLSREDFRGFARRLDASRVFVAKLSDRQI